MFDKPIIETVNYKSLLITVQQVFKASFNDTYWIEEKSINLDGLDREKLTWFDHYNGNSKQNTTLIAVAYCSDEKFVILEKQGDTVKEHETQSGMTCIISEDFNEYTLLASHIEMR